jgi:hypothetical protein
MSRGEDFVFKVVNLRKNLKSNVLEAAIYRYRIFSTRLFNTLGGSRNKLAIKITESLLEKAKHPERDFLGVCIDIRMQNVKKSL